MGGCYLIPPTEAEQLKESQDRLVMSHAALFALINFMAPTAGPNTCEDFLRNFLAFTIDDAGRDRRHRRLGYDCTQRRVFHALRRALRASSGVLPLNGPELRALTQSLSAVGRDFHARATVKRTKVTR